MRYEMSQSDDLPHELSLGHLPSLTQLPPPPPLLPNRPLNRLVQSHIPGLNMNLLFRPWTFHYLVQGLVLLLAHSLHEPALVSGSLGLARKRCNNMRHPPNQNTMFKHENRRFRRKRE